MRYFAASFLLSILVTTSLYAQKRVLKNRFNAGIVLGGNTSQINGDRYLGYNKFGGFVGVRAIARLNTKSEFVFEMQYNRKGSKDPSQFVPGKKAPRFIALDYLEVPILYHYKVETSIGVVSFEGGIAYARLVGFKINENANSINYSSFTDIENEFKKDELVLIFGGGLFINEHIRLMGRFAHSLTLLYENENPTNEFTTDISPINQLRNIQLAFGVNYIF